MKSIFIHNRIYLIIYSGLLFLVGGVLLFYGKIQIHKAINSLVGNGLIDVFFKYITHLGDGIFAFMVAVVMVFFSIRVSLYILLSYGGAAIVSSFLKHVVYPDIYRPHFVFQYFVRENLKEVDGVDLVALHSFPSGHALSAFALFFCLLLVSKSHLIKSGCFLLAILAAFSRVYLSQHWLIDIYVGSIIGVCFSMLFYVMFYDSKKWPKLNTTLPKLLIKNS